MKRVPQFIPYARLARDDGRIRCNAPGHLAPRLLQDPSRHRTHLKLCKAPLILVRPVLEARCRQYLPLQDVLHLKKHLILAKVPSRLGRQPTFKSIYGQEVDAHVLGGFGVSHSRAFVDDDGPLRFEIFYHRPGVVSGRFEYRDTLKGST